MPEAGTGEPETTGSSRWSGVALAVAALIGVVVLAVVAVMARDLPAGSPPPATIEPWPSAVAPDATPTLGEIPLGRVAVATASGEPALLVRVSATGPARDLETGREGVGLLVEVRVAGPLDRDVGLERLVILRAGRPDPDAIWVGDPVGFPIPADAPVGTQASARTAVFFDSSETVDLGWLGSGTSPAFRYIINRPPPVPSITEAGRCPTLEDYELASLQPPAAPPRPSFEPVSPRATPSTGVLALGQTGIVPAPDGSPGALVRVSNVRFCDRLPDYRPDAAQWDGEAKVLLADLEIETLAAGTFDQGFIPGAAIVVASYGGHVDLSSLRPYGGPGGTLPATLDTGPGFRVQGTVAWVVPDDGVRVTLDVRRAGGGVDASGPVQFSYLAREGTDYAYSPSPPAPTSNPAASPTAGLARVGDAVLLAGDGGTVPLVVDGIAEVPRYPGLAPSPGAGGFMEVRLRFGAGSGRLVFDPAEWAAVGPAGEVLPDVEFPSQGNGCSIPPGWPNVARCGEGRVTVPDWWLPVFIVAEVPADGRITLEYRPDGGPPLLTWVLRER